MTKTATVSLHGNTYQVEPALAGRKVELVFSPFNLEHIEVRYQDKTLRKGVAAQHHPARPPQGPTRTPEPAPAPATGIDYLAMVADTHHQRVAADETINFDALYPQPDRHPDRHRPDGQLPGQLSIDDILARHRYDPADSGRGHRMSVQRLQAHYGFTRMPFGRNLAPGMLHRHPGHGEAVARITWCVDQHALGVITGEVGAGKTVAVRAATAALDTSRHVVIYLPNPSVGVRGMLHHIVAALGQVPSFYTATLGPAGRRRPGRRTRRTRPHPRRRDRRSPPAGQPATGSDPHADQPRHGLRQPVRRRC